LNSIQSYTINPVRIMDSVATETVVTAAAIDQEREHLVNLMVERLVSLLIAGAKAHLDSSEERALVDYMFQKILAPIRNIQFEISADTFENLPETVLKELYNMLSSERFILYCMTSGDRRYVKVITRSFINHLLTPKRRSFTDVMGQSIRTNFPWLLQNTCRLLEMCFKV